LQSSETALLSRARRAVDAGSWREALSLYQQFLQSNAKHADAHYELAWLLRNIDEPVAALSHYQRALDLLIARPEEVHLNRAVIFSEELHDYQRAQQELAQALRLRPNYFEALLNRGNLQEDLAQKNNALESYQQIIDKADTNHSLVGTALARILQLLGAQASELQMQMAQQLAKRLGLTDATVSASLYFAIAHVRQAQHDFAEAFALIERANQLNASTASSYHPAAQEALFDALIADVRALALNGEQQSDQPKQARFQPLFIVGMFRSGSTLIEQVLNSHPQVQAFGEISFLPRLVAGALQPYPNSLAGISHESLQAWSKHYLSRFERSVIAPETRFCTDKRPDNFMFLGLIKRLFPQAKIIHTVRNPLDNGLSIFQQQLDPQVAAYASDLSSIAHHYAQHLRLMDAVKSDFTGDLFELDYEQFVQNPERVLRDVLQFLDLDWSDGCLQFHQQTNAVKTASLWQVRQPINTVSQGRWRVYRDQLQPLIDALRSYGVSLPLVE
jgi:tetratricopeptide (TPR) repeat protein